VRNGSRNTTIGKARKRFGERTDTLWTASARAARQTSNGCFTPTIIRIPYETWNGAPAYYPGSDYVDWLGLSVYGQQYKDEPNPDIPSLVDWPYQEMSRLDPHKPIMIAEWATGEFPLTTAPPNAMHKPAWIEQGLELFRTRYPRSRQRFIGTSVGKTLMGLIAIFG
jgi:hypothetical protein